MCLSDIIGFISAFLLYKIHFLLSALKSILWLLEFNIDSTIAAMMIESGINKLQHDSMVKMYTNDKVM